MAPQRKLRGRLTANRQDGRTSVATNETSKLRKKLQPSARVLQQQENTEANVDEWVYRFLGNLAAIEQDKQKLRKRTPTLRFNTRSQKRELNKTEAIRRLRSPTPYSWDKTSPKSVTDALQHPVSLPIHKPTSEDVVPPALKASVTDPQALLVNADHTLLSKINRYIKAGIAEGKRRAKRYVRKALSFAIEMGYLVPADSEGKLLRVSAALIQMPQTVAAKTAKKRQAGGAASSGRVRRRSTRRRPQQQRQRRRRHTSRHPRVKRRGQGDDVYEEPTVAKRSGSEEDGRNSQPSGADDELEKSNDSAPKSTERCSSPNPSVKSGVRPSSIPVTPSSRVGSAGTIDFKPLLPLQQHQQQLPPAISVLRPRTSASQRSGYQRDIGDGQY